MNFLSHKYTISQIIKIVSGSVIQLHDSEAKISFLTTDSRSSDNNAESLFFAFKSQRNDGHKYLLDVYIKNCRNFIVEDIPENIEQLPEANIIKVSSTLDALQILAKFHRNKFHFPIIGITGSNGKTVVKEWIYQLLSGEYKIVRSPKSYNSQIGVPISVWQLDNNFNLGVFEAGISKVGEMQRLQQIINPDIGLLTNIGHAHDENFNSISEKISEKLKLFKNCKILIYNTDNQILNNEIEKFITKNSIHTLKWGKNLKTNDLAIISEQVENNETNISALFHKKEISITIPFTDKASAENAIHCWVLMLYLGISQVQIEKQMLELHPIEMRLELQQGINNCSIINDSYSNDMDSLQIALQYINRINIHKKNTVILSDILQTGIENKAQFYKDIDNILKINNIQRLIGIGKDISKHRKIFSTNNTFFETTDDFLNSLDLSKFNSETILLKGARNFQFERIAEVLQQKKHETILEINLSALINNLNFYRSRLRKGTKTMAMVKASSYGSGSFEIASALEFHHVDYLAVAYIDEGVELKKAEISLPIMVMNPEPAGFEAMISYGLEPEIYSFRILKLLDNHLNNYSSKTFPIGIHIKIDTGMRRLGFEASEIDELAVFLKNNKKFVVKSIFSHLVGSDNPELDAFTKKQLELFDKTSKSFCSHFDYEIIRHISNSAAIIRFPEANLDMVRLGIGLYGIESSENEQSFLQNISSLSTIISQIKHIKKGETIGYNRNYKALKDMTTATIPIGYADGINRQLSKSDFCFSVNGKPAKIVGNICMDMLMIDITGIDAKEGDKVIIFDSSEKIINLANAMQTIPYEVLTGISQRVKRVYFQE